MSAPVRSKEPSAEEAYGKPPMGAQHGHDSPALKTILRSGILLCATKEGLELSTWLYVLPMATTTLYIRLVYFVQQMVELLGSRFFRLLKEVANTPTYP